MYNKTIIEFGFRMISWIIKTSCLCYLPQPSASADNTDLGFDNSWYHAQPHPNNCLVIFQVDIVDISSINNNRYIAEDRSYLLFIDLCQIIIVIDNDCFIDCYRKLVLSFFKLHW